MPAAGLEPARGCPQQILSLPRLPISTCRHETYIMIAWITENGKSFFIFEKGEKKI